MATIEGRYRRFTELRGGEGPLIVRQTGLESIAVAQVEPARFELTRAGRRFALGNNAAITGIAPVQVLPTTAAQWAIWNNDKNRSLVIEELGMYLTSGTPGAGGVLLACIFQTPAQTGSNVAGASVASTSDGGAESNTIIKTGVTITTPAAPTWMFIASNGSSNAGAFPGSTFLEHRNLQGSLVIQPGEGLGLAVVAPLGTTPLFAPFAQWVEISSDME